jgi:hypothetical protein
VVGQRVGQHRYNVAGSTRSLEGSLVFFLVSWVATVFPLVVLGSRIVDVTAAVGAAALTALSAMLIEGVSPRGIDNLSVPAISALLLVLTLPRWRWRCTVMGGFAVETTSHRVPDPVRVVEVTPFEVHAASDHAVSRLLSAASIRSRAIAILSIELAKQSLR